MKYIFLTCFLFFQLAIVAQSNVVKVKGIAPKYIGQAINLFEIEDYLSLKESTLASATVQPDSTFSFIFEIKETQKVYIRSGNNRTMMYVEPGGDYSIFLPEKDTYSPFRPAGNDIEVTFLDLDSTDINYKILGFNRWLDNYLALNYPDHTKNPVEFSKSMDEFKDAAQRFYAKDTGTFIFDYVRFTIANTIDNVQQISNRNRYEKHDFYIKHQPVRYKNDAYMEYFKLFYSGMMPTISMEVNNRIYLGLLKNSPSLIMNALGKEYTLINMRLRELAMIQLMAELYRSPDYPQTNIVSVLDSIQSNALFDAHKQIAANIITRLTEAKSGGKAPQFVVNQLDNTRKSLTDYKQKYLYVHFYDPRSEKNQIELAVLKELHKKYANEITFLTICKSSFVDEKTKSSLKSIPWDVALTDDLSSIWQNYNVVTFPNYVLIDPHSYIVQAPALGPLPNSLYQTIEKVFFDIQKALK